MRRPAGRPSGDWPAVRRSAGLLRKIGRLCGDPLTEPGQRERVPVVDAHMTCLDQLEPDHLSRDTGFAERVVNGLRPDVEEPLITGAGVDPYPPQRPEGVRVP